MSSFFSSRARERRNRGGGGRLGGLRDLNTFPYDPYADNKTFMGRKKKKPPPLKIHSGGGEIFLTALSPMSMIFRDGDVEICCAPRTPPRFLTSGELTATTVNGNGYLAPGSAIRAPSASAVELAVPPPGYASPFDPQTPSSSNCFGSPRPPVTSIEPAELPGSISLPNSNFITTTTTTTATTTSSSSSRSAPSVDDSGSDSSSPPDLTPSTSLTSLSEDMALFRKHSTSTPTRAAEPRNVFMFGKWVSQMKIPELLRALPELTETQIKGVWATRLNQQLDERMTIINNLTEEYHAQKEAYNRLMVTSQQLEALDKIGDSAKVITERCNEVSSSVQKFLTEDREKLQAELNTIHDVHKVHYHNLKSKYDGQMKKLVAFIEDHHKDDLTDADEAIPEDVVSIMYEHNQATAATPEFEDAVEVQSREVTISTEEYIGLSAEVKRLRMNEESLGSVVQEQQKVIDANKDEIDLFKLDVMLYKNDGRAHRAEMQTLKEAFDRLDLEKAQQQESFESQVADLQRRETALADTVHCAKVHANVVEEALSSSQRQLADKDRTIERLTQNLRYHRGLLHANDLGGIGRNPALWLSSSRPPRFRPEGVESAVPASVPAPVLAPVPDNTAASPPAAATTTTTTTTATPPRLPTDPNLGLGLGLSPNLNKELPSTPSTALQYFEAGGETEDEDKDSDSGKGKGKGKEEEKEEEKEKEGEKEKEKEEASRPSDDSDGGTRAQALAREFPELVRFNRACEFVAERGEEEEEEEEEEKE